MSANKRGFSALFEDATDVYDDGDDATAQTPQDRATVERIRQEEQIKRRKESYVLHIGSKFRPEHETPYRATNAQVIQAEATNAGLSGRADALPGHSLFDLLVDDVKAGTVRAYTGLDIVLGTMIHPESPKLIKMTLAQMDVDGVLDKTTGGIDVPLYINLTEDQFQNVITQLGFDNINDVSLVKMNVQGKNDKPDEVEQFINQFIGRMGRHKTNVQSTWDTREDFFQSINFKVRIGPQKKNLLRSIEHISRGRGQQSIIDQLDGQDEQFNGGNLNQYENQYNTFLDKDPKETGTSHAGVIEHVMRLTTHRVMSPRLRAALDSVSNLINKQIKTKQDMLDVMGLLDGGGKSHLMTLMEAEFQESESALRSYRDPRAEQSLHNARVFAAGRLIKELKKN